MRATGIVRRVDDLGRIVLPKELRRTLSIREGDPMEIYSTDDGIVLKKVVEQDDKLQELIKLIESMTGENPTQEFDKKYLIDFIKKELMSNV